MAWTDWLGYARRTWAAWSGQVGWCALRRRDLVGVSRGLVVEAWADPLGSGGRAAAGRSQLNGRLDGELAGGAAVCRVGVVPLAGPVAHKPRYWGC